MPVSETWIRTPSRSRLERDPDPAAGGRELDRVRDEVRRAAARAGPRRRRRAAARGGRAGEARRRPASASRAADSTVCSASTARSTGPAVELDRCADLQARREAAGRRRARGGGAAFRSTIARYALRLLVGLVLEQELDVSRDRRQRRAQLVRDAPDELVLQPVELAGAARSAPRAASCIASAARRASRSSSPCRLDGAHQPGQTDEDEDRDRARAGGPDPDVHVAVPAPPRRAGHRHREERRAEHGNAPRRQPRHGPPVAERGASRSRRRARPRPRRRTSRARGSRARRRGWLSRHREVDLVGRDPEPDGHEQQPVAARAPRRPEDQLHEGDQQQQVHRGVRDVHEARARARRTSSSVVPTKNIHCTVAIATATIAVSSSATRLVCPPSSRSSSTIASTIIG